MNKKLSLPNFRSKRVLSVVLVAAALFLLVASPTIISQVQGTQTKSIKVTGIFALPHFTSTAIQTIGNIQYGAGSGWGPMTGGMHGDQQTEFLTKYNTQTGVIIFTGQIHCVCTIDGKTGNIWISMTHGIDVNANNANGKTTGDLTIVGASEGLSGVTGSGTFVTTTSSADQNYTMTLNNI
jgi:hypothetical protein